MPDQTSTPTSLPSANPTAPTPAQQPNTTGDQTALPIDPTTGQPVQPTSRRQKEVAPGVTTPITESSANFASSEALTQTTENISTGPVEVEPPKELEPEVEKVVERIRDKKVNAPEETVVSADTMPTTAPKTVSKPIVVLPLTEKGMKKGRHKGTQTSIRWLYEWCVRQIRKLKDFLVVYRED